MRGCSFQTERIFPDKIRMIRYPSEHLFIFDRDRILPLWEKSQEAATESVADRERLTKDPVPDPRRPSGSDPR
jgi:hypothetical protein